MKIKKLTVEISAHESSEDYNNLRVTCITENSVIDVQKTTHHLKSDFEAKIDYFLNCARTEINSYFRKKEAVSNDKISNYWLYSEPNRDGWWWYREHVDAKPIIVYVEKVLEDNGHTYTLVKSIHGILHMASMREKFPNQEWKGPIGN